MANTQARAPRNNKRAPVNLTASKQATVTEVAAQVWTGLYKPVDGDAEATAAAFKTASDQLQKLFEETRKLRDESKPTQRERLDTGETVKSSIGKNVSDLQAAYVMLEIGQGKNKEPIMDRIALPKVRLYSEMENHPMHKAAVAFLDTHGVRFVEREGKGKGRKVAVLEKVN